ncbi:hypothetical protein DASC09_007780 [Saccharomycopsis crataegensis]|uniref:Uncharacterized protein n=1 Tax=Saccharomycopsis crataegensis TaxID=43959 RepID=A0AAV5QF44_9ASCO|nr:hypothetical protein DASC09_007780 [Saccharomycopsis crataegensis]
MSSTAVNPLLAGKIASSFPVIESVQSTLDRSKLIEAQQRELIKQRLLESPNLEHRLTDSSESEFEDDGEVGPLSRDLNRSSKLSRNNIPPSLNIHHQQMKHVPMSIKTAPMRMDYRKSIMMKKYQKGCSLQYIPVRNMYQNSLFMMNHHQQQQQKQQKLVSPQKISKSPYIHTSSSSYIYNPVPMNFNKSSNPRYAKSILRSTSPPRITKTTITSSNCPAYYSPKTGHSVSATYRKKITTPIVADVFEDALDKSKQLNKLAPFESQPMSARGEYFNLSDKEFNFAEDEEEQSGQRSEKIRSQSVKSSSSTSVNFDDMDETVGNYEDQEYDVESWAIEDGAETHSPSLEFTTNKSLVKNEIKIGAQIYSFDMKLSMTMSDNKNSIHLMNSKMIFLNHCGNVWNKFVDTELRQQIKQ